MKKLTQNDYLKNIYHNINNGCIYGKYQKYGADYNLYLTVNGNIGWCHYGSSCNKNTLKDLKWIITTIFDTTPEQFTKEYDIVS